VELRGSVVGLGALAKSSVFRAGYVGEIPLRVKIDGRDPRLIPDLTGCAEIILKSEPNALIVPRTTVFDEDGSAIVFVKMPEGWEKRRVELGTGSYTSVAVRSGLQKGDVVATERPI
jgi:HlyD family secretion protein